MKKRRIGKQDRLTRAAAKAQRNYELLQDFCARTDAIFIQAENAWQDVLDTKAELYGLLKDSRALARLAPILERHLAGLQSQIRKLEEESHAKKD